jgi:ELWxxDGT repeat protein
MRIIFTLILLVSRFAESVFGQCSDTPQPVDYLPAPILVGNTSFYFKYNQTVGYQLWKGDINAQNGQLVKILGGYDNKGSSPTSKIVINGTLYFIATDTLHGSELWKSDGTEAGTVLVKDINAGSESTLFSTIYSTPEFTDVNGILYFATPNRGLWKSDGTTAGTLMVASIDNAKSLTNLNGTLYFIKDSTIWKSDGTPGGTVPLNQLNPDQFSIPRHLTNVNGTLFFMAYNNTIGYELWKTDGTDGGTVLVKDINPTGDGIVSSYYDTVPFHFTNVNGILFFYANNGVNGTELWKSDGTSVGTTMVKDIWVGAESSVTSDYGRVPVNCNGVVYFYARTSNYNDGVGLWKSDGTTAGTVLVKNLSTIDLTIYNAWNTEVTYPANFASNITSINGTIFFAASNAFYSAGALCKTDGTPEGTVILKNMIVTSILGINNIAYVAGADKEFGDELWKSDGTQAGTVLVKDIHKGLMYEGGRFQNLNERNNSNPTDLIALNGNLFFTATDGIKGFELWKSNGTEPGTSLVKDIDVKYTNKNEYTPPIETLAYSNIPYVKNLNGTLVFSFWGGTNSLQIWKSDGTTNGTTLLKENLNVSSDTTCFTRINNTIYFAGRNDANGGELWKTDGTIAGTVLVKNINDGKYNGNLDKSSNPAWLYNFNNTLFFIATDSPNGRELWKSDGTNAGTVMVRDFWTGEGYQQPNNGFDDQIGRKLFFTLNNQLIISRFNELWKSDGTEQGTTLIQSFYQTGIDNNHVVLNNKLYFGATNSNLETPKVWRTDGTPEGTQLVKDLPIYNLGVIDSRFIILTNTQVWISNGTEEGTTLIKNFADSTINTITLTKMNMGYVFSIRNGISGSNNALWYTDGTINGTKLVRNNFTGDNLISAGLYTFFTDGYGTQVVRTDGTTNGTVIVKSSSNGTFNSIWPDGSPSWAKANGNLFVRENIANNSKYTQVWYKISLSTGLLNINLSSPGDDINSGTKNAIALNTIAATNKITGTAKVSYQARSIQLNQGFKADSGTVFKAEIGGCN